MENIMYRDIESGEIVTVEKLRQEFAARLMAGEHGEFDDMTFAEYLRNSLTRNNGTLEEVTMRKFRVTIMQTRHVRFEVEVEARTKDEAIEKFDRANMDGEYWETWDDAFTYSEVEDENMLVEEVAK